MPRGLIGSDWRKSRDPFWILEFNQPPSDAFRTFFFSINDGAILLSEMQLNDKDAAAMNADIERLPDSEFVDLCKIGCNGLLRTKSEVSFFLFLVGVRCRTLGVAAVSVVLPTLLLSFMEMILGPPTNAQYFLLGLRKVHFRWETPLTFGPARDPIAVDWPSWCVSAAAPAAVRRQPPFLDRLRDWPLLLRLFTALADAPAVYHPSVRFTLSWDAKNVMEKAKDLRNALAAKGTISAMGFAHTSESRQLG
jgi:hypothetical protein